MSLYLFFHAMYISDESNKVYKIFLHYYGKLASTLPVTILCHHLVTKKVITASEVEEIHALPTSSRKAVYILRKISDSLVAGQTNTFNVFLSVIEEHGNVDSIHLVSCIKKDIKSATGKLVTIGLGDINFFCNVRLLHELFNVIIAILHVKIKTQPDSLKSLLCQY